MTCNVEPSGIEYIKFPRLWGESRAVKTGKYPNVSIGITGKEFGTIREHMPEEHEKIILGATVFARMSPDQKAQLIEDLQDLVRLFEPWCDVLLIRTPSILLSFCNERAS